MPFALDSLQALKLWDQEGEMADIVAKDVRTYVKALIIEEFGSTASTGRKGETGCDPNNGNPDNLPTYPVRYNLSEDLDHE
jgi:hypothetical protein